MTAKLSRQFYDRFGDEIANELVEWFNNVDATYRGDLRELNELNFARFDAKLDQRTAQLDAKIEQRTAQIGARLDVLEASLLQRLEARIGASHRELLHWILGSWLSVMLVLLGTLFAVLRTR